jgi:subtilisin family serine protease
MHYVKQISIAIAAIGLAACSETNQPAIITGPQPAAPVAQADAGDQIPGRYIVMFNSGVTDAPGLARRLTSESSGQLGFVYEHAIKGFSAQLSPAAAEALAKNPNVALVEPDQVMSASTTQAGATWGLDRIDQRNLPLSTTYTYANTGSGVTAYIIDTGILFSHTQFGGRATSGYDAITAGGNAADCNGHGTHVAGTVGGSTYGVAKSVALVAVRVLGCNGSGATSAVIAGIDWVTANHSSPAVANMSLGGSASSTLDAAVNNSIASGVTYAIAAGNGDFLGRQLDACTQSPARVAAAITVSATNSSDAKASWANYGNCVDFFAPGVNITSSWYTSTTATNTISGTSMATPHVTGAAALYLESNPGATPQQVRDALYNMTTKGIVTSSSTANNHLLYVGNIGSTPPANVPPTASFTYSCSSLSCNFSDASTDGDGSIASRSWNFGDGSTSTATNPSHTYTADGSYTVTLIVTDNSSAADTASQSVAVSSPAGGISLSATGYKVKGIQKADLTWSGSAAGYIDVYRNGARITTTANDGAYTDSINAKGSATYTYKVCEAGTTTCSNTVTVVF